MIFRKKGTFAKMSTSCPSSQFSGDRDQRVKCDASGYHASDILDPLAVPPKKYYSHYLQPCGLTSYELYIVGANRPKLDIFAIYILSSNTICSNTVCSLNIAPCLPRGEKM